MEPIDYYILNGPVESSMEEGVVRSTEHESGECCAIFLTTYGGLADVAYRVMRTFQRHYKRIKIIIPTKCKSAGTIMAIAANELLVAETGELGPLDVQIIDNIKSSRNSGLDFNAALSVAREEVVRSFIETFQMMTSQRVSRIHAIESAGRIAQGVASALYSQIDPMTIAAMKRSILVAKEYGLRLAERTNSISPEKLNMLIAGYPAHSFCIDREEAKTLFSTIKSMEDDAEVLKILTANAERICVPNTRNCVVLKVGTDEKNNQKARSDKRKSPEQQERTRSSQN